MPALGVPGHIPSSQWPIGTCSVTVSGASERMEQCPTPLTLLPRQVHVPRPRIAGSLASSATLRGRPSV